ncbi:hypothetical protein DFH11DRAFT_1547101 [Phellopilus nigrolimitatus]|nr:hypothetical protein DFH11DRAFT_1547101 [Phellopilus nigrolimitatus]
MDGWVQKMKLLRIKRLPLRPSLQFIRNLKPPTTFSLGAFLAMAAAAVEMMTIPETGTMYSKQASAYLALRDGFSGLEDVIGHERSFAFLAYRTTAALWEGGIQLAIAMTAPDADFEAQQQKAVETGAPPCDADQAECTAFETY